MVEAALQARVAQSSLRTASTEKAEIDMEASYR
jgi:hypothetical protein